MTVAVQRPSGYTCSRFTLIAFVRVLHSANRAIVHSCWGVRCVEQAAHTSVAERANERVRGPGMVAAGNNKSGGVVPSTRAFRSTREAGSDRETRAQHALDGRVERRHVDWLLDDGDPGLTRARVAADRRSRDDDHREVGVSLA